MFQNSELLIIYISVKGGDDELKDLKYITTSFSSNNKFEKVNDEFVKVTISVMSCDQIANGTKFTKEAVTNALDTLNYAPLIGYFNGDDFEGHGIEYVISDSEFKCTVKTIPFGVVVKDSQRWEKVQKQNGEYEDYLVVDAYMWSRYEEATSKVKENKCNQSMEVICNAGTYKEEGYFEVTDFSFSGLCILGENVAPAFNLAKVRTSESFDKDEFTSIFEEMTEALKAFLEAEEDDFAKCGDDDEDKKKKCEDDEDEEDYKKKKRCEDDEDDEDEDEDEEDDEDNDEDEDEDVKKKRKCSEEEYEAKIVSLKAQYSDLLAEHESLKEKYSSLENEVVELREYKATKENELKESELEDEVFSKFESLRGIEGYEEIYNLRFELSKEDLTMRLKALAYDNGIVVGKKEPKKFSKDKAKKPLALDVKKDRNPSEWDTLIFKK